MTITKREVLRHLTFELAVFIEMLLETNQFKCKK